MQCVTDYGGRTSKETPLTSNLHGSLVDLVSATRRSEGLRDNPETPDFTSRITMQLPRQATLPSWAIAPAR